MCLLRKAYLRARVTNVTLGTRLIIQHQVRAVSQQIKNSYCLKPPKEPQAAPGILGYFLGRFSPLRIQSHNKRVNLSQSRELQDTASRCKTKSCTNAQCSGLQATPAVKYVSVQMK